MVADELGHGAGQRSLDALNADFWNDLCGALLARSIGVVDRSQGSLRKFDEQYFAAYPYLLDYIPFAELRGRRVLEIGLGYGTLAQCIAESGALYSGLDIAHEPVAMVNQRLRANGLGGQAQQGSILAAPF